MAKATATRDINTMKVFYIVDEVIDADRFPSYEGMSVDWDDAQVGRVETDVSAMIDKIQ